MWRIALLAKTIAETRWRKRLAEGSGQESQVATVSRIQNLAEFWQHRDKQFDGGVLCAVFFLLQDKISSSTCCGPIAITSWLGQCKGRARAQGAPTCCAADTRQRARDPTPPRCRPPGPPHAVRYTELAPGPADPAFCRI